MKSSPPGAMRPGSWASTLSITLLPRWPPAHADAMPPRATSSSGVGT
eukprot:CAMPEP_0202882628 /NCGR_PEP_ID=MMETSP1391-20130828/38299_1 /ASSEMBLY_ACC=CAM_ASM_000867 /TAXON_ID=1034604 /ORGANISM="Chlamydomonas leiostraca, Strain SAG 11-49" /LENGTH=46 /DNA_ID= /DNA_START= /DNA_END= /DNA_ORIENTATION=